MIQGLFETHINVTDLKRSAEFYEKTLGLELAYEDNSRPIRFYWIGTRGKAMLGLWEKDPAHIIRQHFAFQTSLENMKRVIPFLKDRGLYDEAERLSVHAWMPAVSIYFRDPDGHSLEFISMLLDNPRPDMGIVPWNEWEELHGRILKLT